MVLSHSVDGGFGRRSNGTTLNLEPFVLIKSWACGDDHCQCRSEINYLVYAPSLGFPNAGLVIPGAEPGGLGLPNETLPGSRAGSRW
jgi:hypothetical protein